MQRDPYFIDTKRMLSIYGLTNWPVDAFRGNRVGARDRYIRYLNGPPDSQLYNRNWTMRETKIGKGWGRGGVGWGRVGKGWEKER